MQRLVTLPVSHTEEITEEIDEAGIGKLCTTSEQEKIDGVHCGGVYEMVPMRDTDEMHGMSCAR